MNEKALAQNLLVHGLASWLTTNRVFLHKFAVDICDCILLGIHYTLAIDYK